MSAEGIKYVTIDSKEDPKGVDENVGSIDVTECETPWGVSLVVWAASGVSLLVRAESGLSLFTLTLGALERSSLSGALTVGTFERLFVVGNVNAPDASQLE